MYACVTTYVHKIAPYIDGSTSIVSVGAVIRSLENRFRGQKSTHWRNNLAWLYYIMYMQYVSMFLT